MNTSTSTLTPSPHPAVTRVRRPSRLFAAGTAAAVAATALVFAAPPPPAAAVEAKCNTPFIDSRWKMIRFPKVDGRTVPTAVCFNRADRADALAGPTWTLWGWTTDADAGDGVCTRAVVRFNITGGSRTVHRHNSTWNCSGYYQLTDFVLDPVRIKQRYGSRAEAVSLRSYQMQIRANGRIRTLGTATFR